MASLDEDLCAADYVRMLLLTRFKGKTDIERLENYLKRSTYFPSAFRYKRSIFLKVMSQALSRKHNWLLSLCRH